MKSITFAAALGTASTQMQGDVSPPDTHPPLNLKECSGGGECSDKQLSVVLDSSWRWMHNVGGYTNCIDDSTGDWEQEFCPEPDTCTTSCAIEGLNVTQYCDTYGVSTSKDASGLTLKYVPGSRVYLLDESGSQYQMFNFLNKEFTFTIDLSSLPCGTNAALYLVEMDPQGGGKDGGAGADYGTGYCDAQCPQGAKFVDGKANSEEWKKTLVETPEYEWKEGGPVGKYGACCAEFDILEANNAAQALTAHPCSIEGVKPCTGAEECGNKSDGLPGWCDKDGCGFNPYRLGEKKFYGPGSDFSVDSSKPFTVVTQFITDNGQDDGELIEIKRLYVQDGKVIDNSYAPVLGKENTTNIMDDKFCTVSVEKFNVTSNHSSHHKHKKTKKNRAWMDTFKLNGGMKTMGEAIGRGMVMALSVWDDGLGRMNWLDSQKTLIDEDPDTVGVARGPCSFEEGDPATLREDKATKKAYVTFSDLKMGPIGSTYSEDGESTGDSGESTDDSGDEGDSASDDASIDTVSDFAVGSVRVSSLANPAPILVVGSIAAALAALSMVRLSRRARVELLVGDEETIDAGIE